MLATTSWDELGSNWREYMPNGRQAWSVMDRLRRRGRQRRKPTSSGGAEWETIVAMAFVPPPADTLDLLDAGGGVLDVRSGDRWDLFFPGHFKSSWEQERSVSRLVLPAETNRRALSPGTARRRPAGQDFLRDWYFDHNSFDVMRSEVETQSQRRFVYDGRPTLVVVRAVYDEGSEPVVDWASLASGPLSDRRHGTNTMTLAEVVHRISTDLEQGSADSHWGVGAVLSQDVQGQSQRTAAADIGIAAVGGTLAVWLSRMLGL